jgi:hypothetical protein
MFVSRLREFGVAIQPEDNSVRLAELEAALPKRMPASYESFLSRYSFLTFEAAGIEFFGWDSKSAPDYDMIPMAERDMSRELLSAGFVQIGRPDTAIYDPVCFDLNSPGQNREYRIVQADHEQVLQWSRVKILREIWPSFLKMVESYISE